MKSSDPAFSSLRSLLADPTSFITQEKELEILGQDRWFAKAKPEIALEPTSAEEVAAILKWANKHEVAVTTRGAGYGYVGGSVPIRGGILLSTKRLNKILRIDPHDFIAVVQPGVITGVLQQAALEQHLFYPPDPASLDHCSIGGNIATNAGGPRCLKYGVTRHYVLGLEVALADGRLVRTGGKTHKNKTGFDLNSLFVGSEGLLGIVTEATLRLLPHPPAKGVLSASFASTEEATKAIESIFKAGFLPAAVEVIDRFTLEAARNYLPSEKSTSIQKSQAHLLIEVDGQKLSVLHEVDTLKQLLLHQKALQIDIATDDHSCALFWQMRRSFSDALRATGLIKLNEDVVVPRGKVASLIRFVEQLQKESGYAIAAFGHAGDGNIHVNVMISEQEQKQQWPAIEGLLNKIFDQVLAWGGTITGEHGIGLAKLPWWEKATTPEIRILHHDMKKALDPKGILNPGKFC